MTSREFFYQFGRLFYKIDSYYADFAKKSGVKPNLLWVLYALDDNQPHSQRDISKSWDIPMTTVNTIVLELQKNGYVELKPIAGKKREMRVVLTDSGKEYSKTILSDLYEIEERVFQALGDVTDSINVNLEKMLCELKNNKGE